MFDKLLHSLRRLISGLAFHQPAMRSTAIHSDDLPLCPCCGQAVEPEQEAVTGTSPVDPLVLLWSSVLQRLPLPSTRLLLSHQSELVELIETPEHLVAVVEVAERWAGFTQSRCRPLEQVLGEVLARPVAVRLCVHHGDPGEASAQWGGAIADGFNTVEPPQRPCPPRTPRSRLSEWARQGVVGFGVSSAAIASAYRRLFGTSATRDPAQKGHRVYSYREVCLCLPAAGYHTSDATGVM